MNEEVAQLRAGSMGIQVALQAVLRAILKTHPESDVLLRALKFEGEEALSLLLGMQVPDTSLDAFRDTWNHLVPFPDGGPDFLDPRL